MQEVREQCASCEEKTFLISNGDRIRSMNNEELAHFLAHIFEIPLCSKCNNYTDGLCYIMENENKDCKIENYEANIQKWLDSKA